jgi:hypothetical protein
MEVGHLTLNNMQKISYVISELSPSQKPVNGSCGVGDLIKINVEWGLVVQTCNPQHLRRQGRSITTLRSA